MFSNFWEICPMCGTFKKTKLDLFSTNVKSFATFWFSNTHKKITSIAYTTSLLRFIAIFPKLTDSKGICKDCAKICRKTSDFVFHVSSVIWDNVK